MSLVRRLDGRGASVGADLDVARARELGLPVYTSIEDIPLSEPGVATESSS